MDNNLDFLNQLSSRIYEDEFLRETCSLINSPFSQLFDRKDLFRNPSELVSLRQNLTKQSTRYQDIPGNNKLSDLKKTFKTFILKATNYSYFKINT